MGLIKLLSIINNTSCILLPVQLGFSPKPAFLILS